ncbi:hypothetical protein PHYPO_G00072980 [Pangasianodon hypophthalmus]|uniref:SOWAHA-C winged helix-turn-helix domain-containing protein n=1 Tax=Pangasianodon hypophthalmus TaxID=310915 RepID=A0A5N5LUG3_PANHP|nr:hypothetical protein PHYPO_G00072980 [Pangasianodon hypophthalmus]
MGDISEASLLEYIYSSGGKVTNSDLMKTYKQFVSHSDLHLRAKYREDFKLIIDRIAVCKCENGEKYLILKKKYRQLMQERESEPSASAQELKMKKNTVEWCVGPTITVTDAQDPDERQDVTVDQPSVENPELLSEENPEPTDAEDELEKDSGSKSESEQEEESTGIVSPAAVALDPIEKEWICSAACGRLSHLTQLLKRDASLANKKVTSFTFPASHFKSNLLKQINQQIKPEKVLMFQIMFFFVCMFTPIQDFTSVSSALHWAAKHGKEDMAAAMADAGADVNTKAHVSNRPCFPSDCTGNW